MSWLAQNWVWIALAIGAYFFMTRAAGCGAGHSRHRREGKGAAGPPTDAAPATQLAKGRERHRHGCC